MERGGLPPLWKAGASSRTPHTVRADHRPFARLSPARASLGAVASGVPRDAAFVLHGARKAVPSFGCHRSNWPPTVFLPLNFNTKKSHPITDTFSFLNWQAIGDVAYLAVMMVLLV